MNEFTETTAENLALIRGSMGMNQEEIAEMLGIPKTAVSNIENDKRTLSAAEKTILDWHFFGIIPASVTSKFDLEGALEFSEAEWRIVGQLARREGITEAQWITGRIRSYLAYAHEQEATQKAPNVGNKTA
jgi:transcriptional regulator with XRE-family HTH domain